MINKVKKVLQTQSCILLSSYQGETIAVELVTNGKGIPSILDIISCFHSITKDLPVQARDSIQ